MGLLADIFGQSGQATAYFGGQWWMTGLFLIFVFALYFYGRGFTTEAMSLFLFSAIILVTIENLFEIPSDWIILIIIFITIVVGLGLANLIKR